MDNQDKPYPVQDGMTENHIPARSFNLPDERADEIETAIFEAANERLNEYKTWDDFYFAEIKPVAKTEEDFGYANFLFGNIVATTKHHARQKDEMIKALIQQALGGMDLDEAQVEDNDEEQEG